MENRQNAIPPGYMNSRDKTCESRLAQAVRGACRKAFTVKDEMEIAHNTVNLSAANLIDKYSGTR